MLLFHGMVIVSCKPGKEGTVTSLFFGIRMLSLGLLTYSVTASRKWF